MAGVARRVRLTPARVVIAATAAEPDRVLRYTRYWRRIAPRDDVEYFNRWLFAYASVQTGWGRNCAIYRHLTTPGVSFVEADLRVFFAGAGAGLINNRSRGVAAFHRDYWADPASFRPAAGESFVACRDRLVRRIHGLGIAKVSFALELCYPLTCDVVCLDRHLLRLYGVAPESCTDILYRRAEAHWRLDCARHRLPCPIARHIYWDDYQGEDSSRYWSSVFERPRRRPAPVANRPGASFAKSSGHATRGSPSRSSRRGPRIATSPSAPRWPR